jgi:hypothetical protein
MNERRERENRTEDWVRRIGEGKMIGRRRV